MKTITALALTLSLGASSLFGNEAIIKYFDNFKKVNPNIVSINAKILEQLPVENSKWTAYRIELSGEVREKDGIKPISTISVMYSDGYFITPSLTVLSTGKRLAMKPDFNERFYDKDNLISGSTKSLHKIIIFSDPLCPICLSVVPDMLKELKQYPKEFAVYYYNLPLRGLHPAAETIVKAELYISMKKKSARGRMASVLDSYKVPINPRETNEETILSMFNAINKTKLTLGNINSQKVLEEMKKGEYVAKRLEVSGTPTVYFDGEKDDSRSKHRDIIQAIKK